MDQEEQELDAQGRRLLKRYDRRSLQLTHMITGLSRYLDELLVERQTLDGQRDELKSLLDDGSNDT